MKMIKTKTNTNWRATNSFIILQSSETSFAGSEAQNAESKSFS